jgi:hypothetical protein
MLSGNRESGGTAGRKTQIEDLQIEDVAMNPFAAW